MLTCRPLTTATCYVLKRYARDNGEREDYVRTKNKLWYFRPRSFVLTCRVENILRYITNIATGFETYILRGSLNNGGVSGLLIGTRRRKITSLYLKSGQLFKKKPKGFLGTLTSSLALYVARSLWALAIMNPNLVISFANIRMSMSLARFDFLGSCCSIHYLRLWRCLLLSRLPFPLTHPVNNSSSSPSFRMIYHTGTAFVSDVWSEASICLRFVQNLQYVCTLVFHTRYVHIVLHDILSICL